jgi:hypothetical protein
VHGDRAVNNKRKVVSPQEFGRFLAWLDPDPNVAGEYYNDLQRKLTIYFLGRGCRAWAAELASQTLDRTVLKYLEGGEIDKREPGRYIFQVAGFILLEHLKRPPTTPLAVEVLATTATVDNRVEVQCCKRCLAQLPEKEQGVLQDYYLGQK